MLHTINIVLCNQHTLDVELWRVSLVSYQALSLKEMGAVPGGAFRTFCDPVYRMSIPISVETWVDFHKPKKCTCQSGYLVVVWLFRIPCWSIRRGAPPIEATESTRKRQSYLHAKIRAPGCYWTQFKFLMWQQIGLKGPISLVAKFSDAIQWVEDSSWRFPVGEEEHCWPVFRQGLWWKLKWTTYQQI